METAMLPPPRRPSQQQIERQRDLRDVMTSEQRRWFRRADDVDVKRSGEEIVFSACDIVKRRGLAVNFAAVRGTGLVGGMPAHVVRAYVDQWNARVHGPKTDAPPPNPFSEPAFAAEAAPEVAPPGLPEAPAALPEPADSAPARDIPQHPAMPDAPAPRSAAAPTTPHTPRGRFAKTIDSPRRGRVTPVESLVLATRTPLSGGMLDLHAVVEKGAVRAE